MKKLFLKRHSITSGLDSIAIDLELRGQALTGDDIAASVLGKESREDKKKTLDSHVLIARSAKKLIDAQFDLINELTKKK